MTRDGITVGALAAVNAAGSAVVNGGPWFWAAPFERDAEFGGRGLPAPIPPAALEPRTKANARASTTLVVVATDAALDRTQTKRLAVMAQTGVARAIYPVHTPLDGDLVFAAATGQRRLADPLIGAYGARRARRQCSGARHRAGASTRRPPCPSPARCRAGRTNSVEPLGAVGRGIAERRFTGDHLGHQPPGGGAERQAPMGVPIGEPQPGLAGSAADDRTRIRESTAACRAKVRASTASPSGNNFLA